MNPTKTHTRPRPLLTGIARALPLLTGIQECLHLQISSGRISNDKPSCINCGLVMEVYENPYIRNISHYKALYSSSDNRDEICNFQIVGDKLREQVMRFKNSKSKPKQIKNLQEYKELERSALKRAHESYNSITEIDRQCLLLYYEYIDFLRNNEIRILPKKNRTRPIYQVYGDHRRIVFEYIVRLYTFLSSFCPPE